MIRAGQYNGMEDEDVTGKPDRPALSTTAGKRIVLTTMGSLGDLHPYLAISLALKARGHGSHRGDSSLLSGESGGPGTRLPARTSRSPRLAHRAGSNPADARPPPWDGFLRPEVPHARPAGFLRGHARSGRGGGPAGIPPSDLCHPTLFPSTPLRSSIKGALGRRRQALRSGRPMRHENRGRPPVEPSQGID